MTHIYDHLHQSAFPRRHAGCEREITVSLFCCQADTVTLGKPLFADTVSQSTTRITQQGLMQVWHCSAQVCQAKHLFI